MKSVHYVASVTRAYRLAIDAYFEAPEHFQLEQSWLDELEKVSHRPYTTGFYYHQPDADDQLYGTSSYQQRRSSSDSCARTTRIRNTPRSSSAIT